MLSHVKIINSLFSVAGIFNSIKELELFLMYPDKGKGLGLAKKYAFSVKALAPKK